MYTMNEISTDLIENLQTYIEIVYEEEGDISSRFYEHALYLDFLRGFVSELTEGINDTGTEPTSPLYIFKLLDAKPSRPPTLEQLQQTYSFYTEDDKLEITKSDQSLRTLLAMIQFLNISTYIYKRMKMTNLDEHQRSALLQKLTIAAASEYHSLYSSRKKNEFAYYFEKLLTTGANTTIEPCNTDKHRWRYNEYTTNLKLIIDTFEESSFADKMETEIYSNIVITYGKMKDETLPALGMRYFINISILNPLDLSYNPIFNTNFN